MNSALEVTVDSHGAHGGERLCWKEVESCVVLIATMDSYSSPNLIIASQSLVNSYGMRRCNSHCCGFCSDTAIPVVGEMHTGYNKLSSMLRCVANDMNRWEIFPSLLISTSIS